MSSKSAIKTLVPQGQESALFKWVAILTGSKTALKGAGFLLSGLGFRTSLWVMAGALLAILAFSTASLPRELGKSKSKNKLSTLLSKDAGINRLSAARFFLFGARDIWFVVAVPVFPRHRSWLELHRDRQLSCAMGGRARRRSIDGASSRARR